MNGYRKLMNSCYFNDANNGGANTYNLLDKKTKLREKLEAEINKCEQEIKKIEYKIISSQHEPCDLFTGKVFLTFGHYASRYDFLRRYSEEFLSLPYIRS